MEQTKEIIICPTCKGTGEATKYTWDTASTPLRSERCQCPTCDGTGRVYKVVTYEKLKKNVCTHCNGTGVSNG